MTGAGRQAAKVGRRVSRTGVGGFGLMLTVALAAPAHAELAKRLDSALDQVQAARQATELDEIHLHLLYALFCVGGREALPYPPADTGPCTDRSSAAAETSDALQKQRIERAAILVGAGQATGDVQSAHDRAEDAAKLIQLARGSRAQAPVAAADTSPPPPSAVPAVPATPAVPAVPAVPASAAPG